MKRIVAGMVAVLLLSTLLLGGCGSIADIVSEPMVHITYTADRELTAEEWEQCRAIMDGRMKAIEMEHYTLVADPEEGVLRLDVPRSRYPGNLHKIASEWGSEGEFAICMGESENGAPAPPEYTVLDNSHIASAEWQYQMIGNTDQDVEPVLVLTFTDEGAKIQTDITTQLATERGKLYFWMDYELFATPQVMQPITEGEAVISGFTDAERAALYAAKINGSVMPCTLIASADFSDVEE